MRNSAKSDDINSSLDAPMETKSHHRNVRAVHQYKELHGKMLGATTNEELDLDVVNDTRQRTVYSQYSYKKDEGPTANSYQLLKTENTRKVRGTYELSKKTTTHASDFTFRMEKQVDETQVT